MKNDGKTITIETGDLDIFHVNWSEEDMAYAGTHPRYPSLSYLAPTVEEARAGIVKIVVSAACDDYFGV